jgi:hypothetical protein
MMGIVTVLRFCAAAVALLFVAASSGGALAQEPSYSLTIEGGKFQPATLTVKAGVKFKLSVTNKGTKPAEFESAELNREKVVPAGGSITVYIGPLSPGTYTFFDDFDQKNRGQIVAK